MSLLLAALAFGLLIAVHEFGHMWVARKVGMRVERFSIGFGPVIFTRTVGETEYVISAVPLGGYVKIAGMSPEDEVAEDDAANYANRPAWARLLAILAGPAANYVLAFVIGVPLLMMSHMVTRTDTARLGEVVAGDPAAQAGLQSGDEVLSVGGSAVADFYALKQAIVENARRAPGQPVPFTVRRGGQTLTLPVTPRPLADGYVVGITPWQAREEGLSLGSALPASLQRLGHATQGSINSLAALFTGRARVSDLSGPIGMISATAAQARKGFVDYLQTVWGLSVAIGFFNLLPIPALDGGRIMFLGYELLTRRRVSARLENLVHTVGLVLLLGLIAFVSYADILRKVRGG